MTTPRYDGEASSLYIHENVTTPGYGGETSSFYIHENVGEPSQRQTVGRVHTGHDPELWKGRGLGGDENQMQ